MNMREHHVIRTELLRMKWQLTTLLFQRALRRHLLALKYSPDQPRDELGRWTYAGGGAGSGAGTSTGTRVAGPGAGRSRGMAQSLPGATSGQLTRLETTIARTENTLAQIRQYDPNWQPR